MAEVIGRIKKTNNTEIVVQKDEYGGEGITIREYLTSNKYTGFTKKGTKIPKERWPEFKEIVTGINLE